MAMPLRFMAMASALIGGYVWVRPAPPERPAAQVRFEERAETAGCRNVHSMCRLHPAFENIMPWLSSVGAAAAAADYDGDGFADLYVTHSGRGQSNRLFRNRGDGTFEDVTTAAGVGIGNAAGACMHSIWGDVDGDGDLDLYVIKWGDTNTLFRNEGGGRFTDISKQAGVDFWGYGNAATFFDYDRDGKLDILLGNYFADTIADEKTGSMVRNDLWNPASTKIMHETFTHAANGGRNVLYRNRGDGTFEDVTTAVGMTFHGWTLSVGAGDLNNDGWPDLYIANDFGPDEYYLNTGATEQPPKFRLVIDPRGHPGVGNDWWKGMNVDFGDVNNDGYLDIYVTNILSRKYKTDEGNMLWLNSADAAMTGGRGFTNIAEPAGAMDGGWGWGGKFADFDLDGLMDIFTVNGFVTGHPDRTYWYHIQEMVTQTKNQTVDTRDWPIMGDRDLSGREPSRLFMQIPGATDQTNQRAAGFSPRSASNTSEPRFCDAAESAGITDTFNGRGIALADYNHDGLLDIYVANQGAPSSYYVNRTVPPAGASFLRVELAGRPDLAMRLAGRTLASTTRAIGARVTIETRSGRMMREVQGGIGYSSQSEYPLHFGVPDPAAVERITVQWPSGRTQEITDAAARGLIGRHVRWVEGAQPEARK